MSDWSPITTGHPGQPGTQPLPDPGLGAADPTNWKPWDLPPDIAGQGMLVGACGYDFPDWAGRFYPPGRLSHGPAPGNAQSTMKASAREWFPFYQLYFSFLEIGHTFQQAPLLQYFVELERRSKAAMRFAVKVHRDISHKGIWNAEAGKSLMRKHAAAVSPLAETGRFHSFLIQMDDGLERDRRILDYLLATASAAIGEGLDVHIEFRNRTWHQESVLQSLKDAGVGICNTEIPALPHAFPLKAYATSGKGYVRYSGLNLAAWQAAEAGNGGSRGSSPSERQRAGNARYGYLYSQAELQERVRGQLLLLEKTGSVAVAFQNHVGARAALNAWQSIHLLSRRLGPP